MEALVVTMRRQEVQVRQVEMEAGEQILNKSNGWRI